MITFTPCESQLVRAHGYDATTQTLALRFGAGGVYHYKDVPQSVYDKFVAAKSLGAAFGSLIRGQYAHEIVLDESKSLEPSE